TLASQIGGANGPVVLDLAIRP
ncbi:MAG: hypothetical protein JWR60_3125, partial [Polaromonas sp.]|nr:hypothetical protein [Polaromonas sp.]